MSLSAETPMVHVALDKIPCPSLVMQDSGKSYFVLLHSKGKPENAYNMNFVFWPKLIVYLGKHTENFQISSLKEYIN